MIRVGNGVRVSFMLILAGGLYFQRFRWAPFSLSGIAAVDDSVGDPALKVARAR